MSWKNDYFYCATTASVIKHVCRDPQVLRCGHHVCKEELSSVAHRFFKCSRCYNRGFRFRESDDEDEDEDETPQKTFEENVQDNLEELFESSYETLKYGLENLDNIKLDKRSKHRNEIKEINDEINQRISSLDNQLDEILRSFINDLDSYDLMANMSSKFDQEYLNIKAFEKKRNELQKSFDEPDLSLEKFYETYAEVKELLTKFQNVVNMRSKIVPKFKINRLHPAIDKNLIGKINIEKFLNFNLLYSRKAIFLPHDALLLSDNTILYTLKSDCLLNYNPAQNSYRKIKNILPDNYVDLKEAKELIFSVAYDNHEYYYFYVFLSDSFRDKYEIKQKSYRIIKTNLKFNLVAKSAEKGLINECKYWTGGLCYYNGLLYVCVPSEKCIQTLNSDLEFQQSFEIEGNPTYIKNIKNVALIKTQSNGIYFYDLDKLVQLSNYSVNNCIVGTIGSNFYVLNFLDCTFTLRCFNSKGKLLREEIRPELRKLCKDRDLDLTYGSIIACQSKMYVVTSYEFVKEWITIYPKITKDGKIGGKKEEYVCSTFIPIYEIVE